MIDRSHALPVTRQCQILSLARSTAYYRPQEACEADLALMRKIDELHLEYPFAGSRMLRDMLRQDGHAIGRKHVATLMKRMNIEAVYKKPNTSRRHPAHAVYPYLLRHMKISRPNHVFAADITYIPMKRGFVYLFAVMDWASRRVLAWRLSNTLTTDFCIEAVQEAIHRYGKPDIFNTNPPSSRARNLPNCSRRTALPSEWTAEAVGAITSLSNGYGSPSSMKRSTCVLMKRSVLLAAGLHGISTSTTAGDPTVRLTR